MTPDSSGTIPQLKRIVDANWFKSTSLTLIVISAALLGLETSPSIKSEYRSLLHLIEGAIVWLFTLEIAVRIAAFGRNWHMFFRSGWNLFDFVVVASCFIPAVGELSAVARLARVLRALRLVSFLPNLQLLIEALLKSFASMGYVALLLSMVFYVYGIIGVGLFSHHDPAHFGSLSSAWLTLFQVLTLEGWVDILSIQQEAAPLGAPIFFISFILLGTMIVLNLFIGVIVNGMAEAQEDLLAEKAYREGETIHSLIHALEEQLAELRAFAEAEEEKGGAISKPRRVAAQGA